MSSIKDLSRGSAMMVCIRFEEVVSRGAGAAVALFSNAVIREMYKTRILAVKVSACPQGWACCVASWQGLALAVRGEP